MGCIRQAKSSWLEVFFIACKWQSHYASVNVRPIEEDDEDSNDGDDGGGSGDNEDGTVCYSSSEDSGPESEEFDSGSDSDDV